MAALGKLVVSLALEYAQYTKGLDKSDQQALKFAQNVQRSADKASASFTNYASGTVKSLVGMGAAYLGINSVVDKLFTTIDDLAKLDDLAQTTGSAVENLSKMQQVAKQFNFDFGQMDPLLQKLAKGMASVDNESNKTNKALAALGISSRDAAGNLRDPSQVAIEIAKNLQNYADGAGKVALIQDAMGKSAAGALPYLNDLAENVDRFSGVSAKAAADAARLQDQIGGFKVKIDQASQSLISNFIPGLSEIIDKFNEGTERGGALMGVFEAYGQYAKNFWMGSEDSNRKGRIETLTENIKIAGKELEQLQSQMDSFGAGKNSIDSGDGASMPKDAGVRSAFLKKQAQALAMSKELQKLSMEQNANIASPYVSPNSGKPTLAYTSGNDTSGDAAAKKVTSTYDALIGKSQDYVRNMGLELAAGEKLTEGQKNALEIREFLAENGNKLGKSERDLLNTWLAQTEAVDKATQAQNARYERVAAWVEYQIQLNEAVKAHSEGLAQATASYDSLVTSEADQLKSVQEQIDTMRFGVKATSEMKNARLLEAAAAFDQNAAYAAQNGVSAENIKSMTDRAQALRNLVAVRTELADKQVELDYLTKTKAFADDTWRSIGDGLTDALFRGFERGEAAGDNFFKRMKDLAKTTVLKFTTEFLISPLKSMFNSILMDVAAAARNGSTAGGVVDVVTGGTTPSVATPGILAQGKNIFGAITKGFDGVNAALYSTIRGLGEKVFDAGFEKVGSLIFTNSTLISKALPYAGAVMSLLKGDIKGAAFQGAGVAIGSYFGGPVGGAIGSAIGSAISGLIGGGKKSYENATFDSTYNNGVLSTSNVRNNSRGPIASSAVTSMGDVLTAFGSRVSTLLDAFDLDSRQTYSTNLKLGKNLEASFGFGIASGGNGGIDGYGPKNYGATSQEAMNRFITDILTKGVVQAFQTSALSAGIKGLFNSLSSTDQIDKMIASVISLKSVQTQLTDAFNITVDQSAQVANATGLTGDALSTFIDGIVKVGQSYVTTGDVLQSAEKQLNEALDGAVLPATLKEYDAFLKNIDKGTAAGIEQFSKWFMVRDQFAAFTTSLESLKSGVSTAVFSLMSDDEQLAEQRKQYLAMFADLGMAAPESAEELRARAAAIDFTTKAGQDFAAMFPSIVDAFNAMQPAGNALIAKFRGYADDLKAFAKSLESGVNASLSPQATYDTARADFEAAASKVASGDESALASIASISQAFIDASKSFNASTGNYFADLERVKAVVNVAQISASAKADVLSVTDMTAAVAAGTKDANADLLAESKKQTAAAEAQLKVAQAGYSQMLERLSNMEESLRKQANATLQMAISQ